MCLSSTLWALPHTAFSQQTKDTHELALCSPATPPPPENLYAIQETTVLGGEDSTDTDSSPNDHPGAIWLSLGLVEMSEGSVKREHPKKPRQQAYSIVTL